MAHCRKKNAAEAAFLGPGSQAFDQEFPTCAALVQHLEPGVQDGHAPAASGTSGKGRAQQQHFGQRPHALRIGSKNL